MVNKKKIRNLSVINSGNRINKKGQQMTLGTIIAIVLGITVLVLLIFGFSQGWNTLWDQVTVGTSSSNVELKITDCESDCSAGEKSAWCYEKKDLRFFSKDNDKIVKVEGSCFDFFNETFGIKNKIAPGEIKRLGFNNCTSITSC